MSTLPDETPASDPDTAVDRDVVVVGGGAAGLSAAVFLARYGLDTLVLARGNSAIHQCAHLENYLGFPGGLSPQRFLDLGRAHAEAEGATVEADHVEAVDPHEDGFAVETQDGRSLVTRYLLAASAYDGEYLSAFEADLESDDEHDFLVTEAGRTPVDGLYVAGWLTRDTVHQAVVNAGDGARAAIALARDDLTDRYWPAIGERYVDWVVDDDRYGGDGWHEDVDDWFDREMVVEDLDVDSERVEQAREDLKAEFLDRGIDEAERERRERHGQQRLLEHLEDDLVLDRAREILAAREAADLDALEAGE
ncbi:NAD(P)/FAD-dependent oxidoreductase [Halosimplex litoreum]|uniref:NAD(P)/FAD-dependent oxidoreductase n=1 Tax=Halosimplex litoreum TaxID=1198301 RepID=A0A7T3KW59_9EURY|nr:FAD-dependent oxidoreductase [Halosimplex litoreum]QPV63834.1 NAD(P)/FAD-dependent oxidoreductase [Halosimplex litoreum]